MKRLLLLTAAAVLLVAPSRAQAQSAPTQNDLTTPEFRQVLLDLGSYLDAHKGSDLRRRFEALTDDSLTQLLSAIPNPHRFRSAVAALKQHDAEQALKANASIARVQPEASF